MKINLKNLKGEIFSTQIEPTQTIGALKLKIEAEKGFTAQSMKIIYKGKTTKDQELLEQLGLKETDFLVVMNQVSKPAPKPKVEDKNQPPPEKTQLQPELKAEEKAENNPQPSSQPSQSTINDLMAMGFPRQQCVAAARAAFGNSDRAVEYLLNGIPQNPPQNHSQGANILSGIQNLPQIEQLRQMLQNDPSSLPQILGQINNSNPQLYNLIMQHPQEFQNVLMGEQSQGLDQQGDFLQGEEGEGGQGQLVVSQQQDAAITRLSELGFSKMQAAQAYMACDKNQQLAANLLFERLANGDIQQAFPGQSGEEDDDNLFN